MKPYFCYPLLLTIFLVPLWSGCDSAEAPPADGTIVLTFKHSVSGDSLILNSSRYVSPVGIKYAIQLLEYIVSDVALTRPDGSTVPLRTELYVNAAEERTIEVTIEDVPAALYTGLTFTLGLKPARNQDGALPNTQNFNNMAWPAPLGGGYHNMRLEGRYLDEGLDATFAVHTGPTNGADNSLTYTLRFVDGAINTDFELEGNTQGVNLTMNLAEWFQTPQNFDFRDYPGPIMPNQAAQDLVKANGRNVFQATLAN